MIKAQATPGAGWVKPGNITALFKVGDNNAVSFLETRKKKI